MSTAIILCTFCVSAFMIWSSLQSNLAYVVISDAVLDKWKAERPNLIIIELLPKAAERTFGRVGDCLEVPHHELASLLCWIPRRSTVVICQPLRTDRFDRRIEAALLRAAIDTVYMLDAREYVKLEERDGRNLRPIQFTPGEYPKNQLFDTRARENT
jgi:hypothetical protein